MVAARLGHADRAITLRVYAHVLRDQAVEVAQIFASVVDRPQDEDSGPLANRLAAQTPTSVAAAADPA